MNRAPRTVIVTGAAGGIGTEILRTLDGAGWRCIAVDRQPIDDQHAAASVVGDVTDETTWDEALTAAGRQGSLQAVVNAAGIQGAGGPIADTELDEFRRVVAVNLDSAFLGTRTGLANMPDGGSIINIASTAGLRGVPSFGPYAAAKHAVLGLTKTAAAEGGSANIRCNAICPGPTDTTMIDAVAERFDSNTPERVRARMERANPMRRFGQPAEVANAVAWLATPEASYINGAALTVDGGLTTI